jgi:hypothetical protein
MKDIFIYTTIRSWLDESPDATLRGKILDVETNYIQILDENGYTQIIMLDKLYAVVY